MKIPCAICGALTDNGLTVLAACDDHWDTPEQAIGVLVEQSERAEAVVAKVIAFRRACAREITAAPLLEVADRQAELFDAVELYERRRPSPGGTETDDA